MSEETKELLNKLSLVADVAAQCCIDLNYNLKEAHKEYIDGKIPRGAYEYVLARHGNLYNALYNVGYTEKHKIFEFPIKPKENIDA